MSKTKSVSAFIAGCAALALSCWFVTGALPLKAEPQEIADGPGVSVDINGASLMHRSSVFYPREAYIKGIQGTVTAQVKLDSSGNVVDAAITAGPDELRKTVLQSLLDWHFASDSANSTRQVTVNFTMPKGAPASTSTSAFGPPLWVRSGMAARVVPAAPPIPIKNIVVRGLPDAARDELLARLPVHAGDTMTPETNASLALAVHNFDEHLTMVTTVNKAGELTLEIRAPGSLGGAIMPPPPPPLPQSITSTPGAVRLDAQVAAANLISQAPPDYPALAKAARVQGAVRFDATIGKDGTVQNLHLLSGPPLLVQAAMQAVRDWTYKPTLLNGQPIAVNTTIDINFTLPQ